MSLLFKLAMFITSFLPLWVTILFLDIINLLKNDCNNLTEVISIFIIVLINLISILIVSLSIKEIRSREFEYEHYKIIEVMHEKGISSEYLLSYILPLFVFDFTLWSSVVQFLIYFSVLAFLCIRNDNIYINLLFECRNYKFYSCELILSTGASFQSIHAVVISKVNLTAEKGNTIKIVSLNKPFYFMK